jgi:hypothetical protein
VRRCSRAYAPREASQIANQLGRRLRVQDGVDVHISIGVGCWL